MPAIRTSFLASLLFLTACKRDSAQATSDTSLTRAQPPASTPSRYAATGWPDDAGPVVVLPGASVGEVRLVMPELTDATLTDTSSFELDSLPHAEIVLYSRGQKSTPATIEGSGTEDDPRGCKSWPGARLGSYRGEAWSFGLAADVARELPLHTWGSLLTADSVDAAAAIIQIAATVRNDSTFAGIPFGVRYLYRLELGGGGGRTIVADAVRRINTEANVREQHVLVIAERIGTSSRYRGAYREAQTGREDAVRVPEIVGAVLLGENRRPALFVSLEYSEGSRLVLLERDPSARWVSRWRSAYTGC
ncbi:MAG TPA: hypothetical protein VM099_15600 [Gemmatimonadaceae bacterium]|nr:hypothetical protein [Gemmatimonadaceae bacterium]